MADGGTPTLDARKLGVYLDDHLAGSIAGLRRMRHAAQTLAGTPAGALVAGVADQVEEEKDELVAVMSGLDLHRSGVKQIAAWLGERASRLKADGRLGRHTSMNTLLEVEILRSAVIGKKGLWQTLEVHAEELGLDGVRMRYLADRSDRQASVFDEVHAFVRRRALMSRPR